MTLLTKDLLNGASLKGGECSRPKANSNPSNTMRKYQQLALGVVSLISLMAFLFYKHEYDRLRYTLEYLEMFGVPPDQDDLAAVQSCGSNVYRRIRTVPPSWVEVSDDLAVYSAFWDEGNGLVNPVVRTLAVVKKSNEKHFELKALLWYEGIATVTSAECSLELIKERTHATFAPSKNGLTLVYLVCRPEIGNRKTPLAVQFQLGHHNASPMLQVQESDSWKSVVNVTAVCAFAPGTSAATTQDLIEFVAFYNAIGVEKFTFFGLVLTPLARKILDKYSDEAGVFYEEFQFNMRNDFSLSSDQMRSLIEKDCTFRHRDTHENILVLAVNQFVLPRTLNSIQSVLNSVPSNQPSETISEFHFESQSTCLDSSHKAPSDLLLASQLRTLSDKKEEGVALIRPHLSAGLFRAKTSAIANSQHIPSSIALVLNFQSCSANTEHSEDEHLPSFARFAEKIRKSLFYRKWKISL